MLLVLDAVFFAINLVFGRHCQFFGRYEVEGWVEMAHGHNEGMDGTAVF